MAVAASAQMDPAQMQAAMQSMQLQLREVYKQNQDAALQVSKLEAAAAALVPLPGAPGQARTGAARPQPIPLYDGSKGLPEWLLALRQQDRWYGYVHEADRLRLALAYLSGAALAWSESAEGKIAIQTWDLLEAGLIARFQPITSEELARAKIFSIVQGPMSAQEYVSAYNTLLAALPDQDPKTTLHNFLRGLKTHTRELLRAQGVKDYAAATVMAVRIGNPMPVAGATSSSAPMDLSAMEAGDMEIDQADLIATITHEVLAAMQRQPVRSHGSGTGAYKGAQGGGAPRPPRGLPSHDGLSPTEVRAYLDAGKCFSCGQTGHTRYSCPKKAAVSSFRRSGD